MEAEVAPVTVAIATFNRSALLVEALKSCRNQTLRPASIVVVDDGSSDGTSEAVASLGWPEITYVNPGKVGLGRARNIATSLTRTKYLCIMDDDDIMLPNRIRDHMRSLVDGAQLSHGGWINFNGFGELEFKPGKTVSEDVMVYAGGAITHGACCYVTEALLRFPYREDLAGGVDFDLAIRLVRSGLMGAHTGSYVLLRRRHDRNLSLAHGDVQQSVRRAVVELIDEQRSPAEREERRNRAAAQSELVATPAPSLMEIYDRISGVKSPMTITVEISREANAFFAFLARQRAHWVDVLVIDAKADLGSTVTLAFQPNRSVQRLEALKASLLQTGVVPRVQRAEALGRRCVDLSNVPVPSGHVRLALKSSSLDELFFAHRLVAEQQAWRWYVVARAEVRGRRPLPAYYLVSAPLRRPDRKACKDLRLRFHLETDLSVIILEASSLGQERTDVRLDGALT